MEYPLNDLLGSCWQAWENGHHKVEMCFSQFHVLVGRRGTECIIKWNWRKTIFHVSEKLAKHGRPHREGTELDGLWHNVESDSGAGSLSGICPSMLKVILVQRKRRKQSTT